VAGGNNEVEDVDVAVTVDVARALRCGDVHLVIHNLDW